MAPTLTDPGTEPHQADRAAHPSARLAPVPRIGEPVFYRLDAGDVRAIHRQRLTDHVRGAPVRNGDVLPAVIVRVSSSAPDAPCNLTVFLDGPDTYWAQQTICGTEPGTWARPARAEA